MLRMLSQSWSAKSSAMCLFAGAARSGILAPMRLLVAIVTGIGVAAAGGALAQSTTVIGSGPGRDCYTETLIPIFSAAGLEKCDEALRAATLVGRDLAATYVNRGILRMRGQDYIGALEDFASAEKIRASLPEIYVNRGATLIYLGRNEEAVEALTKSIEMEVRRLHVAYFNRGIAHRNLGLVGKARADYAKAVELAPDWDLARRKLAELSDAQ